MSSLRALILMGGESRRMGTDKAAIQYHESPQWRHLARLLAPHCDDVFWSCNSQQKEKWSLGEKALVDKLPGLGPIGGLLTAFENSSTAWLVVACDYPHLDTAAITSLIAARNPAFDATAFGNPENQLPEPLLAIWEPSAQKALLSKSANGEQSPRRVLSQLSVKVVGAALPSTLENVNYRLSW